MAGMLNSDNEDKKAAIADLSNLASMYAQNDVDSGGIMGAPKGDNIDAGSWWSWLNGTTRQKTDEYKVQAQEDLQGMDFSGAPAGYQSSMEEDLAKLLRMRGEANPLVQTSVEQLMVSDDLAAREDLPAEELNDDEYFLRAGELREPLSPAPVEDDIPSTGLMSPDQSAIEQAVQEAVSQVEPVTEGEKTKKLDGKDGDLTASYENTLVKGFVDLMGEREGTQDHTASEGQFTYAYGITQATADSLGINPDDYNTRKEFAEAVYSEMYDGAKEAYPDVFEGMGDPDNRKNILSMYINLGRLPTGVETALSGPNKDFAAAGRSLTNVIHFTSRKGPNKGKTFSSKGVSKRRAEEYNDLMGSSIVEVQVLGPRSNPTFNWLDSSGNTIESYTSNKPLSPDNSLRTIRVN